MPTKKSKTKKAKDGIYQRDEQTGRDFRVISPVPLSPKSWTPTRAALKAMERVYGKNWRTIAYDSYDAFECKDR